MDHESWLLNAKQNKDIDNYLPRWAQLWPAGTSKDFDLKYIFYVSWHSLFS